MATTTIANVLAFLEADAALAASIFHFKKFRVKEVKEFLRNRNINVRI